MQHLLTYQNTRSSVALATAFGWHPEQLTSLDLRRGQTRIDISNGRIGSEPAALFGSVSVTNGYDPIESAALYAYHSSTPWGIVADEDGLTIVNSQWLVASQWFKLPRITWDKVADNTSLLEAFTPKGVAEGDATIQATKVLEPSDFLVPVDEALVQRLDRWRDQAVKYASETNRVDELLQTFYAQLFVLRTIEDRSLDERVEPASSASPRVDHFERDQWGRILSQARDFIGSDLFESDVTPSIAEHVLAGVITDLYKPHKVPGLTPRYNFAWITSDVLGSAYEKYLASILKPSSLPTQIDLFLPPERSVERYSVRKSVGAYYTPKYITDYLSTRTVDNFYKRRPLDKLPAIIDFACGSGSFLVAAVDKVLLHLKRGDPTKNWARELIDGHHIAGIDIDQKAVTAARLRLWQRLIEEPDALPLPNLSEVIVAANGLDTTTWGILKKSYDIVLGNPPFLATSLVDARESLESRFSVAVGRYDFSSLFVDDPAPV